MLRTQRRLVVFLATAVAAAFAAATGIAQNITTDFSGEWTVVAIPGQHGKSLGRRLFRPAPER